jgi:hypothetical protein
MQERSDATPRQPSLAGTLAATVPGKPIVKAPTPPAWSKRRRVIGVRNCCLAFTELLIPISSGRRVAFTENLAGTSACRFHLLGKVNHAAVFVHQKGSGDTRTPERRGLPGCDGYDVDQPF